ncbi:DNA ligase 4 [Galdieria sulphuraria]|nr:DNA ligase 4 [Galdieria sulphuraria]
MENEAFSNFCSILEKVLKTKGTEEKLTLVESFWRRAMKAPSLIDIPARSVSPLDSFSILRLLLPELDNDRRSFGMKERGLAELYISVFELDPSSFDAQRLRRWQDPTVQQQTGQIPAIPGNFFSVLEAVLRHRCSDTSSLTISQVNELLNELNITLEKEKRKKIFHQIVTECTVTENIWISRIILKQMHLGLRFESILKWFHPSALEDYRLRHSLRRMCEDCFQPGFYIVSQDVILGQPASVSLAKRQENLQRIPYLMSDGFFLEPKFDGERLQLHKKGEDIQCFSRNALDTTHLYGPHLKTAVLLCVDAQDCVLDGEVLLYNVDKQAFEHFDQIRHYISIAKDTKLDDNFLITYMIFDVLYVDQNQNVPPSVVSFPLETRKEILKGIVRPFHSQIRLVPYKEGTTVEDIKQAMEDFIEQKYEGVVVKNKKKPYLLGKRDDEVMIKLKPDYFNDLVHDLDVLILGAFIGTGYSKTTRIGKPSHFLIGILEKDIEEQDRNVEVSWIVIGKVGSGYSYEQLEQLQHKLAPFWKPYDKKAPPEHLKHSLLRADGVPDFWIEPCHSIVLTIYAYEVRPSAIYSGYAVRFPRVANIRWDKRWFECSTLDELTRPSEPPSASYSVDGLKTNKKRRAQPHLREKVDLISVPTRPEAFALKSSLCLDGLVLCVVGASSNQEKQYYEKLVHQLGGKTVQSVTQDTRFVLAISPNHVAVTNMVRSFQNPLQAVKSKLRSRGCLEPKSILKVNWLLECQVKDRMVEILPCHVVWATDSLRKEIETRCDCWGDSWHKAVNEEELRELLSNMFIPESVPDDVKSVIASCPELKEIDYGGLFRSWHVIVEDFGHFCETDAAAYLVSFFGCDLIVEKQEKMEAESWNDSSSSYYYYLVSNQDSQYKARGQVLTKAMYWVL